jgi:hypothetical protein
MAVFETTMTLIPVFYSDTWGEYVGGFYVDRFLACQPNATADNAFPDVPYLSDPGDVAASSRPGVSPWVGLSVARAMKAAANRDGRGWHLMTAYEWSIIIEFCKKYGFFPRGNDHATIPAASADNSDERGLLDRFQVAQGWATKRALPGTGPGTWTHNNDASSGVYDMCGMCHKIMMGLVRDDSSTPAVGYVLANRKTDLRGSPYGKATSTGTSYITDTDKAWTTNEFAGCLVHTSENAWYTVASNTSNTLTLTSGTPAAGVAYCIYRVVNADPSPGITSGSTITSLWSSGEYLYYNIPNGTGSNPPPQYGNDMLVCAAVGGRTTVSRGGREGYGNQAGLYYTAYATWSNGGINSGAFYVCRAI